MKMKKVSISVCDNFVCCTLCPWCKEIDGEDYCQHPKSAGNVTDYYNDQTGFHPQCPLPSIPKDTNALLFIEELIKKLYA